MLGWNKVLEGGRGGTAHLVKKGVCYIVKVRSKELREQRRGQLNLLSLRQAYLSKRVNRGEYSCL